MTRNTVAALLLTLAITLPTSVEGQFASPFEQTTSNENPISLSLDSTLVVQENGGKSPVLAGVLSGLLFPGIGSYYAGHGGHGTRHLVIGVAAYGLTFGGLAAASDDFFENGEVDEGSFTLAGIGLTLLFANQLWSIVTAVQDVNDHNRSSGSSMSFQPELIQLETADPQYRIPSVPTTRVGLQLFKFSW